MVSFYHKFKSINLLIILSSATVNYIQIRKISSKYKDNLTINANYWGVNLHGKSLSLKQLETT